MNTVKQLEKEAQAAAEHVKELEAKRKKIELEIAAEAAKPDPLAVARAEEVAANQAVQQADRERFMQRLELLESEADKIKSEIADLLHQGGEKVKQLHELCHKAKEARSLMSNPPGEPAIIHRIENLKRNYLTRIG